MSSLVPETHWANGASGTGSVYDNSPSGLGLTPSYLAGGATASAVSSSGGGTISTSLPPTPVDTQQFVYLDSTNHIAWQFVFQASDSYWYYVGGAPLFSEVLTSEATNSVTYAALTTPGPSVALPFSGDYDVTIGATINSGTGGCYMSYDIGGVGAVDNDGILHTETVGTTDSRLRAKTGLSVVTLTAKYKAISGNSSGFQKRWMAVTPARVH